MAFRLRWIAETEVTLIIAFYKQLTKGCVNFLVQSQTSAARAECLCLPEIYLSFSLSGTTEN